MVNRFNVLTGQTDLAADVVVDCRSTRAPPRNSQRHREIRKGEPPVLAEGRREV